MKRFFYFIALVLSFGMSFNAMAEIYNYKWATDRGIVVVSGGYLDFYHGQFNAEPKAVTTGYFKVLNSAVDNNKALLDWAKAGGTDGDKLLEIETKMMKTMHHRYFFPKDFSLPKNGKEALRSPDVLVWFWASYMSSAVNGTMAWFDVDWLTKIFNTDPHNIKVYAEQYKKGAKYLPPVLMPNKIPVDQTELQGLIQAMKKTGLTDQDIKKMVENYINGTVSYK